MFDLHFKMCKKVYSKVKLLEIVTGLSHTNKCHHKYLNILFISTKTNVKQMFYQFLIYTLKCEKKKRIPRTNYVK